MISAKLIVVGGDAKATEVNLKLPTTIGRGREASLTLPHALVSRLHCEIVERDGQLIVRDLGSLNGTFINNQRIEGEQPLLPDELLTLGTVTFRAQYQLPEPAMSTQPPQAVPATPTSSANNPGSVNDQVAAIAGPITATPTATTANAAFAPPTRDWPAASLLPNVTSAADARQSANNNAVSPGHLPAVHSAAPPTTPPPSPVRPANTVRADVSAASSPAAENGSAGAGTVGVGGTVESSASDIFAELIRGASPDKSISLSALHSLPGVSGATSFTGNLPIEDALPAQTLDLDLEQISISADEAMEKPPKDVDEESLGEFFRRVT
jgi:predicted component of type VI protein secretion system